MFFLCGVPGREEYDGVTRCIYDFDCLGVKAEDGSDIEKQNNLKTAYSLLLLDVFAMKRYD